MNGPNTHRPTTPTAPGGPTGPTVITSNLSPEPGDQLWLSREVQTTIVRPTGSLGYFYWVLDDAGNTFTVSDRELRPGKPGVVGEPGNRMWVPRELLRDANRSETR